MWNHYGTLQKPCETLGFLQKLCENTRVLWKPCEKNEAFLEKKIWKTLGAFTKANMKTPGFLWKPCGNIVEFCKCAVKYWGILWKLCKMIRVFYENHVKTLGFSHQLFLFCKAAQWSEFAARKPRWEPLSTSKFLASQKGKLDSYPHG